MKQFYCLALLALLFSCKENKETSHEDFKANLPKDSINLKVKEITPIDTFVSDLRPTEKLKLGQIYTDEVAYVDFDDNGDYPLFTVEKEAKLISLYANLEEPNDFKRGDILEIKWRMDSVYIAGEGEKLDFGEWLVTAKKVKDGNVSLLRKNYKKPIKYYSEKEEAYTDGFKEYVATQVEYYLANSKKEVVEMAIKNPETNFTYSIEEKDKEGHSYYKIGISTDFEHSSTVLQWLYLDSESRNLYEYDVQNDKLIELK